MTVVPAEAVVVAVVSAVVAGTVVAGRVVGAPATVVGGSPSGAVVLLSIVEMGAAVSSSVSLLRATAETTPTNSRTRMRAVSPLRCAELKM